MIGNITHTLKRLKRVLIPALITVFLASCANPQGTSGSNLSSSNGTNVIVSKEGTPVASPSSSPRVTNVLEEEVQYNNYNITMEVQPETRKVTGLQRVTYKNRSDRSFENIYFNLYLNAFSEHAKRQPYFGAFEEKIFGRQPKDYGYIHILNASVDKQNVDFTVDETVLSITLAEALAPSDTVDITLQFEAYIPVINHRTGANGDAIWLGNFIPVLAVHDSAGWHTEPYYAAGHPFYTSIANYTVKITTPAGYAAVGTGEESFTEEAGNRQTTITAVMVRDFAFVVSDRIEETVLQTSAGVDIHVYTYSGLKKTAEIAEIAEKALAYYSLLAGAYPYASLDIAETGLFTAGGMGYSQMIFMDAELLKTDRFSEALTHQIGRQWFYNVVGSNQIKDAWLSEGPVALLQEKMRAGRDFHTVMQGEYATLQAVLKTLKNKTLSRDLSAYADWQEYAWIEQTRAKLMLYSLNQIMGEQTFNKFIKSYYSKYSFKIATRKAFIATAEEVYGVGLTQFFGAWIENDALPPLPQQKK